jgi:hypothetical protein
MKALTEAAFQIRALRRDLGESKVIAPAVVEKVRVLRALIGRAAAESLDSADLETLKQMFGNDVGDEKLERL